MPAHAHSFRAQIGESVSAVIFVDHAGSAPQVAWLARVAERMPVAGTHAVARSKARRRIGRHRRWRTAGQDGSDLFPLEAMLAEILLGQSRCLAGGQFLGRHKAGFAKKLFQATPPTFVITTLQIIHGMLLFAR